jgi:hypothetical protein
LIEVVAGALIEERLRPDCFWIDVGGITSAGATAEWKAELAEAADASPTLAEPAITIHAGDAFVPYSFEVGMDATNFLDETRWRPR